MTSPDTSNQTIPSIIDDATVLLRPYEKMPINDVGFVLIGPSGVGKSTLRDVICHTQDSQTHFAKYLPLTTRAPRPGETDEYRFVTPEVMESMKRKGRGIFGNVSYGNEFLTLWPEKLPIGSHYLYIHLPEAALLIKKSFPNTKIIQIVPSDVSILAERIKSRDLSIAFAELITRIEKASDEITLGETIADAQIVNDGSIAEIADRLRIVLEGIIRSAAN